MMVLAHSGQADYNSTLLWRMVAPDGTVKRAERPDIKLFLEHLHE